MPKSSPKEPKESSRHVETVAKALDILDCFTANQPELSLKDLSEKTGLYKSRVLRLCGTLAAQGFLVRDLRGSSYRLGPKLMVLGKIYEKSNNLISLARPILHELSQASGESASLFVREGTKRICLAREEGPSAIRYSITEGQYLELYAGAGGKVLLAHASEEVRQRVLKGQQLNRFTDNTVVDVKVLEEDLDRIRELGYTTTIGERTSEAAAIGAPVFNHRDQLAGALTVAGPAQRLTPQRQKELLPLLLDAARRLSRQLGNTTQA